MSFYGIMMKGRGRSPLKLRVSAEGWDDISGRIWHMNRWPWDHDPACQSKEPMLHCVPEDTSGLIEKTLHILPQGSILGETAAFKRFRWTSWSTPCVQTLQLASHSSVSSLWVKPYSLWAVEPQDCSNKDLLFCDSFLMNAEHHVQGSKNDKISLNVI